MPINKVKDAMPTIPEERCEKCYEADGNHFVLCPEAGYDFSYEISRESTCWDRGIACASNPELSYLSRIRLRVPDSGIAGGFVWR